MDQSFVGELKVFSRTTVLSVESVMHGGANIKFGLQIPNVCETNIDTVRLEKRS